MPRYNPKYYIDEELWQLRPKRKAINTFTTDEGIKIGMFQGNRGQFPEIDFVVKILKPGINEKLIPPLHSFWVVDLMMKIPDFNGEVIQILEYYIDFYGIVNPFQTPENRVNYNFQTLDYIQNNFNHIEQEHTLSLDYVCKIIELFCLNEKRNEGAYMFLNLLNTLLEYARKEVDYITVIQASQPGFRR